jgi:hypothetical protein
LEAFSRLPEKSNFVSPPAKPGVYPGLIIFYIPICSGARSARREANLWNEATWTTRMIRTVAMGLAQLERLKLAGVGGVVCYDASVRRHASLPTPFDSRSEYSAR